MFADAYRSGHGRVSALVADLDAEQLRRPVPACPEWSVRDLVAHLAGTAADVAARRTAGMPGPAWTDVHVRERRDRTVAELLGEWEEHLPATADALEDRRVPVTVLQDLLAHEGDLAEALGTGQPPWDGWAPAAAVLVRQVVKGIRGPETLVVRAGGTEWRSPDDPGERAEREAGRTRSVVSVDLYEFYRALQSRRSRAQMRRWAWDGPADPWVDVLPVYGPRDDEQPVPPPRV